MSKVNPNGRPNLNGQVTSNDQQLNNLNSLASSFPKVIQKLLLFLPVADLKSARQCTKSLRHAVDQYVGLNFCLSQVDPKYSSSHINVKTSQISIKNLEKNRAHFLLQSNLKTITSEMLDSFKTLGIRSLTVSYITYTPFSSLVAFPHLLQSLCLLGTFNTNTLLKILTQCWNLQEHKFHELNKYRYDELFVNCSETFMRAVNKYDNIRLPNLKSLHLRWKGVATMGFLLVLVSAIEAKNLQKLHCRYCPASPNLIPLVIGTLAHAMDIAAKTLQEFVFVIESGSFSIEYYETSRKMLHRDLSLLTHQRNLLLLPTLQKLVKKLYFWSDDDKIREGEKWLNGLMENLGKKIKLSCLIFELTILDEYWSSWYHFTKHQTSLQHLFLEASWSFPVIQGVVKDNAKKLQSLGLGMKSTSVMNLEDVLGNCPQLTYLRLKKWAVDERGRCGLITNAMFDELVPNLEALALGDVLISCDDMARVHKMEKLTCFMYTFPNESNPVLRAAERSELFGVAFEDFKILLAERKLDYLVVTDDVVVQYGPKKKMDEEEEALYNLLNEPIFYSSVEHKIAMAGGEPKSCIYWFFEWLQGTANERNSSSKNYLMVI